VNHHHPFYPLAGEQKIDLLETFRPSNIQNKNRIEQLAISLFSATVFADAYNAPTQIKTPFSVTKYEIERYAFAGVMIGGYGVWFSGILILSILLAVHIIFVNRKQLSKLIIPGVIISTLFISVIINPACWWARYVPQLWIIPIIVIISSKLLLKKHHYLPYIIFLAIGGNLFLTTGYFYYNYIVRTEIQTELAQIKATGKKIQVKFENFRSNSKRFNEAGIDFVEQDLTCSQPDTLFRSTTTYCIYEK
jgi:hypothetical protein